MEIILVQNECNKYGFECTDFFGKVLVRTKNERWMFEPTNGKVTLYHGNSIGKSCSHSNNDYHIEFRDFITEEDLVRYMYEHEEGKYYGKKIERYSFNNNNKVKAKKRNNGRRRR